MQMCHMQMEGAFKSPPTQLTLNQAAGVAVNAAAAAAAVPPAKASHVGYLITCGQFYDHHYS
jgi:hypothetical protein